MTISAYVGLPGHGKSYTVTEHVILPALQASRIVYTNIPMNDEECLSATGNQVIPFKTDDLIENPDWWTEVFQAGSIIVIDEVWRLWPSGLRTNKAREQDKTFINEHRHIVADGFSTEIVLVSQDLIDVSTFVRNKVDTTYRAVKLTVFGSKSKYRLDVYSGVVTGQTPPEKLRSRQIFGTFKKDIFKLYQSQTRSDGSFGDESRTDDRFNVLKSAAFKIIPIFIISAFFLGYCGLKYVKDSYNDNENQETQKEPSNVPTNVAPLNNRPVSRKKQRTLFDEIDKIYIASNNQILGLQLLVESGNSKAFLSHEVLKQNGIDIKILSDCFVLFFSNGNQLGKAMCLPEQTPIFSQFIPDAITPKNDTQNY